MTPQHFDRLRAQGNEADKAEYLALASYTGTDENLLARKAQVLMNLERYDELLPLLDTLKHNDIANMVRVEYHAHHSHIGMVRALLADGKPDSVEACAFYFYWQSWLADAERDRVKARNLALDAKGIAVALGMEYWCNIVRETVNYQGEMIGDDFRFDVSATKNWAQRKFHLQCQFRSALRRKDYSYIEDAPHPSDLLILARATEHRQSGNFARAVFTLRNVDTRGLEPEWLLMVELLRLELRLRDAALPVEPDTGFILKTIQTVHDDVLNLCAFLYPWAYHSLHRHTSVPLYEYLLCWPRKQRYDCGIYRQNKYLVSIPGVAYEQLRDTGNIIGIAQVSRWRYNAAFKQLGIKPCDVAQDFSLRA